nr:hypothetical protein [Escherichia coli]
MALHTVRCAGSAASGATEEKRRHNNGMWWSLTPTPAQVKTEKTARHLQLKK